MRRRFPWIVFIFLYLHQTQCREVTLHELEREKLLVQHSEMLAMEMVPGPRPLRTNAIANCYSEYVHKKNSEEDDEDENDNEKGEAEAKDEDEEEEEDDYAAEAAKIIDSAKAVSDGYDATAKMIKKGKLTVGGVMKVTSSVLQIAANVADYIPVPYVGAAVKVFSGIFGLITGKMQEREKSVEETQLEEVKQQLGDIKDGINNITKQVEQVKDGISNITETQRMHTEMLSNLSIAIDNGFEKISKKISSEINNLRMEMHFAEFTTSVAVPSEFIARRVRIFMKNINENSIEEMKPLCKKTYMTDILTAIKTYGIHPNGYFMSQFGAGNYTIQAFTFLKNRFKQIMHNVITVQILCESMDKMADEKSQESEEVSLEMQDTIEEYNTIMKEISKLQKFIVSEKWNYIPDLVLHDLKDFPFEDYHTLKDREDAVNKINTKLKEAYGHKCMFKIVAGRIDNVFVDNGATIRPHDNSMNPKDYNMYWYKSEDEAGEILIVSRKMSSEEKFYDLKHFREGKEEWLGILKLQGKRGTRTNPAITFTVHGEKTENGPSAIYTYCTQYLRSICQVVIISLPGSFIIMP